MLDIANLDYASDATVLFQVHVLCAHICARLYWKLPKYSCCDKGSLVICR